MKKRLTAALLAAALCLGLLAGCGGTPADNGEDNTPGGTPAHSTPPSTKLNKPPKEDQIISDANTTKLIERPASFTACDIIKRQNNLENKEDVVHVRLTAEHSFIRAEQQYSFLYNYYDVGGWILDEVTPENEDEWTVTYLDAAGNDIIQDIVWLDPWMVSILQGGDYVGEAGGIHYFEMGNDIYDHKGNYVTAVPQRQGDRTGLVGQGISLGADGHPRFLLSLSSGSSWSSKKALMDDHGNLLAEYDYINSKSEPSGLYLVGKRDETQGKIIAFGAIDDAGKLVVPIQHEKREDVIPELGPAKTRTVSPLPEDWIAEGQTGLHRYSLTFANKVFAISDAGERSTIMFPTTLVDINRNPILSIQREAEYIDIMGRVVVIHQLPQEGDIEFDFQFYDLNGNCRSPVFHYLGSSFWGIPYVVSYQGRYGILPEIFTEEEVEYFLYDWGEER